MSPTPDNLSRLRRDADRSSGQAGGNRVHGKPVASHAAPHLSVADARAYGTHRRRPRLLFATYGLSAASGRLAEPL